MDGKGTDEMDERGDDGALLHIYQSFHPSAATTYPDGCHLAYPTQDMDGWLKTV